MANGTLVVRDLSVSYGRAVRALRGVSLDVPAGAVTAVLGANGAGKTTLLRAISGTLPFHRGAVDTGTVRLGDRSLIGLHPATVVAAGVVQVPEGRRVFGRQRAGLLSGGEQQMLAIGRALMACPSVLLLDEPTLGLAPLMAERIAETVREINLQGTAILLIEQNAALALELSSSAHVLEVGAVALHGPSAELAASDEVRRRYLGVGGEDDGDEGGDESVPPPSLERWVG
jgi:branched-chain amino acid transport system ATP-binding protein